MRVISPAGCARGKQLVCIAAQVRHLFLRAPPLSPLLPSPQQQQDCQCLRRYPPVIRSFILPKKHSLTFAERTLILSLVGSWIRRLIMAHVGTSL